MRSSRVRKGVLRFIIGTHLNYAKKVNRMKTSQVQHQSWFEHSRRKRPKFYKRKVKQKPKRAYAYYHGHYGSVLGTF